MKKLLLSITAVLAVGFINAQIYSASDSVAFSTWQYFDADMDGNNWNITNLTGAGTAFDGQAEGLLSSSWTAAAGPLTPDNVAISPLIDCSANTSVFLSWGAASREGGTSTFYAEKYAVYIVTDPTAVLAGTYPAPTFEGTLTAGDVWLPQSFDVSAVAGGQATVYVVFRHYDCTDQNFIFLDDVSVTSSQPVGLDEITNEAKVFPNPANEILNVETNAAANSVSIISMDGKVVSTTVMSGLNGSVDVSNLTEGVYFYEVAIADGSVIRNTFVKK